MKVVTRYQADDGSLWLTETEAARRDELVEECRAAAAILRDTPDSPEFHNGSGYVQQPTGSREAIYEFLKSKGTHRDSDGPLGRLLARMHRMDEADREWGQAFFAINPHKGRQVAL